MCSGGREERARNGEGDGADKVTACGGRVRSGEGSVFSRKLGRTTLFCFVPSVCEDEGRGVLPGAKLLGRGRRVNCWVGETRVRCDG